MGAEHNHRAQQRQAEDSRANVHSPLYSTEDTATVCRRSRENKSRGAGNCGSCLSAGDKVEIPGALLGKDIKTQERRVIHCRDFYVRHTYLSTTFILINVF